MKKTFQLQIEGKHPERLLEAIKHEIRQYMKRERRKTLPSQMDFWDFDCRFGLTEDSAEVCHVGAFMDRINEAAAAGARPSTWSCWPSRPSAASCPARQPQPQQQQQQQQTSRTPKKPEPGSAALAVPHCGPSSWKKAPRP